MITRDEIKNVAEEAAETALKRMFLTLGINTQDNKDVLELQADLAHTRKWRKSMERVGSVGWGAAITTMMSGVLALIWLGIQAKLGK